MKKSYAVIAFVVVALALVYLLNFHRVVLAPRTAMGDYKTAVFSIDGKPVMIGANGVQYFGNEVRKDLNGDGKEDVAFLITWQPGGSGTFYYLVGAIATSSGYLGTDAFLLGDRIGSQTTESGPNRQVIVNYADRKPNEPFTAQPSVRKSLYLLLNPASLQWGIVDHNFSGESRGAPIVGPEQHCG